MSKVDWITWKTDPSEIIDPKDIENKIDNSFYDYNTYIHPIVYEQIKYELNDGGLTKNSFNIMGKSPARKLAKEIIEDIDIIEKTINNMRSVLSDQALEQRKIEKNQLITSIEKKIESEKIILRSVNTNIDIKNHIVNIGGNPEDVIDIVNNRIKQLNERLEIAKRL